MQGRPAFSLGSVPLAIYIGLAINAFGTLANLFATLVLPEITAIDHFERMALWRALDSGCWMASVVLVSLGMMELAKRQTGPARRLTAVAAALMLGALSWIIFLIIIDLAAPSARGAPYAVVNIALGLLSIAAGILLTLGADAWRRVPIAAAGLMLLLATAYWVPGIGPAIGKAFGGNIAARLVYAFVRDCGFAAAYLFIAGALAATGRVVPDARAAASGFRLARGALMLRLYAALVFGFLRLYGALVFGPAAGFDSATKVALIVAPLVVIATLVVFTIGVLRAAGSAVDGVPRIRLVAGAAAILWWAAIQLAQIGALLDRFKTSGSADYAPVFEIVGPITGAIGIALVGSAIATWLANRGNTALASSASARTIAFVVLALGTVGVQMLVAEATTAGVALGLLVLALIASVASLFMIASVLRDGATTFETVQTLPTARVID